MTEAQLAALIAAVPALDAVAMEAAAARQAVLTKPPGSLGRLEALSIQLAGMTGNARPKIGRKAVIVAAADHGVTAQGVSAYPQAVTRQMVANFLAGGAAVSVLARRAGARVVIADFGVAGPPLEAPGLVSCRIGPGTADFAVGPAMSRAQALESILAGAALLATEHDRGLDIVVPGEMGIGNSTAAAALTAAFTGAPAALVTGAGTGLDPEGVRHKAEVIDRALALHRPDPSDPLGVLAAVGGFEIGGLAGVVLAAAGRRVPVVVDGLISSAAAMVAARLCPAVRPFLIAAHRSTEPGHVQILADLGLEPLIDFSLRLGEGSGAATVLPVIEAAAALLDEMATFDEAGVAGRAEA